MLIFWKTWCAFLFEVPPFALLPTLLPVPRFKAEGSQPIIFLLLPWNDIFFHQYCQQKLSQQDLNLSNSRPRN